MHIILSVAFDEVLIVMECIECAACTDLASYPDSNYAGEGKRACYLRFAVAPTVRDVRPDV